MAADPLREELACTLMLALYGAGRQVEALAVYRDLATRLRELGLTPGDATRGLERRILEHDPLLLPTGPAAMPGLRRAAPIGRERELGRLRSALASAIAGHRTGVMVHGEPGAGKSTLVDAFVQEAGLTVGIGQCLGHRGPGEPYMPMLEALGALARGPEGGDVVATLAQVAPTWLVELPWLLPDGPDGEAVRHRAQGATRARMLREMLEALDAIASSAPLLLVLEDLHWADDSTLNLLDALLRRRDAAPLLVVGTFRPEGEPPVAALVHDLSVRGLCEELAVPRLSVQSVAAYLEVRFPSAPLPDGLATVLAHRTGGNPLFIRNLLDHWLAEGALAEQAGSVRLMRSPETLEAGVPPTLRAHIRDQLDGLPDEDAEVLRAASVAGRDFSADTLAAALDRDRGLVEERCAALAQRTTLIEQRDGGHGFPHDLHREVLYELLPPDARARLHARVGAHLADAYGHAAPDMAAELGFHFLAGRDPERAVRFLRIAAERALGRNAHAEGIRHLRSALDAAGGLGAGTERTRAEVELLSSLGQALVATGGWSAAEAEDALLRARMLAARLSDNEPLVSVLLALATLYELRGEFSRAQDMAQECQRLAPSGQDDHELESTELLACNLFHQGSFARALEFAERGVTLFESGESAGGYTTFPATLGDNAGVSATTGPGWRCGSSAAPTRRWRARPTRWSWRATRAARTASPRRARRWRSCTRSGASPRPRSSGPRRRSPARRSSATSTARRWAACCAAGRWRCSASATRACARSPPASPPRARPARGWTTRTTSRCWPRRSCGRATLQAGFSAVAEALEHALRERSLFYEPELHRLDGALHAVSGDAVAAEACAAPRARPGARPGLRHAGAADRDGPRAARARLRPRGRGARRRRGRAGHVRGGLCHARPARGDRAAGGSGDDARGGQHEHERAEHDAVGDEDRRGVVREPAQQERDRRVADDEREQRRDDRRADARALLAADVAELEQAGEHDRRDRQQERVARRRLAVEAEEQARGDRRAGARHARDERARLREADDDPVAAVDVREVAVAARRRARRTAAGGRAR